jgi:hypothetical protein
MNLMIVFAFVVGDYEVPDTGCVVAGVELYFKTVNAIEAASGIKYS